MSIQWYTWFRYCVYNAADVLVMSVLRGDERIWWGV